MTGAIPLLAVRGLEKRFTVSRDLLGRPREEVVAVSDVSLDLFPGETLGLVGESGCGKTTVGRAILRLVEPTAGTAELTIGDGADRRSYRIFEQGAAQMRSLRKHMQIVFQDPASSLNPRLRVATNIAEPLRAAGVPAGERQRRVAALLRDVGLDDGHGRRFPHELSGGQRQRVAIARAMALDPELVIADEAVSSLDVSIQAQVLNLLARLQAERGLSLLFIAHNLAVVRYISARIVVMYLGRIVEVAETEALFARPRHPYTQALIDAVPGETRRRTALAGEPPDPIRPPSGCAFHARCPHAQARCSAERPALRPLAGGGSAACHFADEIVLPGVSGQG